MRTYFLDEIVMSTLTVRMNRTIQLMGRDRRVIIPLSLVCTAEKCLFKFEGISLQKLVVCQNHHAPDNAAINSLKSLLPWEKNCFSMESELLKHSFYWRFCLLWIQVRIFDLPKLWAKSKDIGQHLLICWFCIFWLCGFLRLLLLSANSSLFFYSWNLSEEV